MHGGETDFIQKPWDNSHMVRLVSQHVVQQQAQRSLRIRKEMEWAEAVAIQRRLLPRELPTVPPLSIAASCRAFDQLGGDYYDVLTMGDKLAICIGDVIGKGLPAALMMSNLQAAVKVTAAPWLRPSDLCHRVNELTCNNGASDKFISFFYGVLDLRTRRLTYSNCGHNPPILRRADGTTERLDFGGTLLGIRATERFQEATVSLAAGDRLLLFTDGLSEAENSAGDQFNEERLAQHLGSSQARSAQEILDEMLRAVDAHCDSRFLDDATAVVVCPE
jgi:sigma-B regulation protein RsbU (phosphoserine phosphatase)